MRNRPRRSLGHVFGAGSATDIERVHWPSCRLNQTRIEGGSRSIWSPGNAASRICSSCSHTSLFSIAAPGARPGPGAARFQAANQTWRSSPFRTSSASRYCEAFSEIVMRASTTPGAISPRIPPADLKTGSKASRASPNSADPRDERLRHAIETDWPGPAKAAVFRASSRAAPFRSSAAWAPCATSNNSAGNAAARPFTAAMVTHWRFSGPVTAARGRRPPPRAVSVLERDKTVYVNHDFFYIDDADFEPAVPQSLIRLSHTSCGPFPGWKKGRSKGSVHLPGVARGGGSLEANWAAGTPASLPWLSTDRVSKAR